MTEGIIHHAEGVDLMPASIELSGVEISLVNTMSRETILRQYTETIKNLYDFALAEHEGEILLHQSAKKHLMLWVSKNFLPSTH